MKQLDNGRVTLFMRFPEIAQSFAKGVHFNTFGGNPVACAIASSVLDVRIPRLRLCQV